MKGHHRGSISEDMKALPLAFLAVICGCVVRPPGSDWKGAQVYVPGPDFYTLEVDWRGLSWEQLRSLLHDAEKAAQEIGSR
jgi:hypothetical protein